MNVKIGPPKQEVRPTFSYPRVQLPPAIPDEENPQKYRKNSVYRDGRQESRLSGIRVLGGEYAQPLAVSSIFALN